MNGSFNTVVGADAGVTQNGSNNMLLGFNARGIGTPLDFATAIGSFATVTTSDTIVIGKPAGLYLDPVTNTSVVRPADTVQIPGSASVAGTLTVGGGTPITKSLNASASLDFPSTANNGVSNLTITLAGALDGDAIFLGVPNVNIAPLTNYTAWVSAPDTVTVRFTNQTGAISDPPAGTFRVVIVR
jgi:hypothetical protein